MNDEDDEEDKLNGWWFDKHYKRISEPKQTNERFTIKTEKIPQGKNDKGIAYWDHLKVSIFDNGEFIGSYVRNYSSMGKTFFPFEQNGKWYALYSKDYTATRVMKLPECTDICGEEQNAFGFCPYEFYVPKESEGNFGFVTGCIWGDDSSWKLEFLDLSQIKDGILKREAKFGYLETLDFFDLKDCLDIYSYQGKFDIRIMGIHRFSTEKK